MTTPNFTVRETNWQESSSALRLIREQVFVFEQKVPLELEWDGEDVHCAHVIALDGAGNAIGTGRLLPNGQIGRMAVLPRARGFGIGSAILEKLIEIAGKQRIKRLFLHAQTKAVPLYENHRFKCIGKEFMEAGILHQEMERWLE